jgi:DnaJ family protein B protein 12
MVVEANRDAARECVQLAKQALAAGDEEKMKRLIQKAKKLDPTCDVRGLLNNARVPSHDGDGSSDRSYAHDDHYEEDADGLRNRRQKFTHKHSAKSQESTRSENEATREARAAPSTSRARSRSAGRANNEFTREEKESVDRIRHCKDYYEILQVTRSDFTEVQLKKKYRELALKLHPDKCKAPGATEAFKALGNAYAVLSDAKKREDYDRYGSDEPRAAARRHRSGDFYEYDVNRGFEAEMSPEDIFEMFFGGGFSTGGPVYRRRTHFQFRREEAQPQQEQSPFVHLLQILPLLFLLFGGIIMQFLVGEPAYSLNREGSYVIPRYTKDLRVPYYVKQNFESDYRNKIRQVEQHVEDEYVNLIRMNCYKEKNHRESLLWTAKMRGDNALWKRAQNMDLPNCKKLEEIYR